MKYLTHHNRPGAMLLITVMIMGSVALIIGISLALRGIGEMEMSFSSSQAQKVLAVADGCVEETLMRLWADSTYHGGKLTLGQGECVITVFRHGDVRKALVEANVEKWKRSIELTVDSDNIETQLLEWKQVR
jgi:hypothetical protein